MSSNSYLTMTLISTEGLDGSGTTTLTQYLTEQYNNTVRTCEPTDSQYGKLVRQNLSDENTYPLVDFYLFMADRYHHIEEVIRPADNNGKIVISDRYIDSTRAYQPVAMTEDGAQSPFSSMMVADQFITETMSHWAYEPDITLYLSISVDTALNRANCDEKYEKRQFLTKVKDNYDYLAHTTDRIHTIDAEQPKERVASEAVKIIEQNI